MGHIISGGVIDSEGFELAPIGLTGPKEDGIVEVRGQKVELFSSERRNEFLSRYRELPEPKLVIDFTHPTAAIPNTEFYVENRIPFVMGTTGVATSDLAKIVRGSGVPAVLAPNMAPPIVALTAMLEWGAENFPTVFQGYTLRVRESHQKNKADTSGTAKALIGLLKQMGCHFPADGLEMVRDPDVQKSDFSIPDEHLDGHAYHTYDLLSDDGNVNLKLCHNILGRSVYIGGSLRAARFVVSQNNCQNSPWSMVDVLKNAKS